MHPYCRIYFYGFVTIALILAVVPFWLILASYTSDTSLSVGLYIGAAAPCIGAASFAALIYMRHLREKRASEPACLPEAKVKEKGW